MWHSRNSGHTSPAKNIPLESELNYFYLLLSHMQILRAIGAIVPDFHILSITPSSS